MWHGSPARFLSDTGSRPMKSFVAKGERGLVGTCEILKKDLIGNLAQEQGITSCAFATTIDDIATSFFTDILFGTVERTFFPSWVIGTNPNPGDPAFY